MRSAPTYSSLRWSIPSSISSPRWPADGAALELGIDTGPDRLPLRGAACPWTVVAYLVFNTIMNLTTQARTTSLRSDGPNRKAPLPGPSSSGGRI
jgi:hypothetical protein